MTPINILSGFRKTGIQPFNPSEVNDRQLAPSLAVTVPKVDGPSVQKDPTDSSSCHILTLLKFVRVIFPHVQVTSYVRVV